MTNTALSHLLQSCWSLLLRLIESGFWFWTVTVHPERSICILVSQGERHSTLSSLPAKSVIEIFVYEQFSQFSEIKRPNILRIRIQGLAKAWEDDCSPKTSRLPHAPVLWPHPCPYNYPLESLTIRILSIAIAIEIFIAFRSPFNCYSLNARVHQPLYLDFTIWKVGYR